MTATVAAFAIAASVLAPTAAAEPVSNTNSESPFIDQFFRDIDADGYGYLDPAWKVSDAAWFGCQVLDVRGSTRVHAANAVADRGYRPAEAVSIINAATRRLCN